MKTKRKAAGFNEGKDKSDDHSDLKESESEKKAKEKKKGKRPCSEKQKINSMTKRRKGVNISEPTLEKAKDKFRVDDVEDIEEEDTVYLVKKKFKGKMKINDDRNKINNRRIAKEIDEILKAGDGPREDAKMITITDKLNSGKRVVDVEMKGVEKSGATPEGETAALLIKAYEDEKKILETDIQQKKLMVAELQAKIQALQTAVPPNVKTSENAASAATPPNVGPDETSQSPM
ncbi:hypothetical protein LIER_25544 [Lithospermum erythrorhizon]|uniref:Uncharacterized protein n=1 Tax=Lithospermum erythrorhizon TaxID=34254 RepID=A0AAV3R8D2_LITER